MGLFPDTEPDFEPDEVPSIRKSLLFYRVMAWVVGIMLVILVCVGMPLKYLGGIGWVVMYVGIAHGWLYPILLIAAYNLGRRVQWPWQRLLAIALAGTVPFLSFVAEVSATRDVRNRIIRVSQETIG
ncbi:integral membrane protein [Propioniciclava tarda]|nr:integral membrane protein [Propioniciclava tarda]